MEITNGITYQLEKTFAYENFKIDEIQMDYDQTTGADCLAVLDELKASGKAVANEYLDPNFFPMLIARKTGIAYDVFMHLPLKDYKNVRYRVRDDFIPRVGETSGVTLRLEEATAQDDNEIENELMREGQLVVNPDYDVRDRMKLISRFGGPEEKALKERDARTFLILNNDVRNFLNGSV